jgi:hypothetical protein
LPLFEDIYSGIDIPVQHLTTGTSPLPLGKFQILINVPTVVTGLAGREKTPDLHDLLIIPFCLLFKKPYEHPPSGVPDTPG